MARFRQTAGKTLKTLRVSRDSDSSKSSASSRSSEDSDSSDTEIFQDPNQPQQPVLHNRPPRTKAFSRTLQIPKEIKVANLKISIKKGVLNVVGHGQKTKKIGKKKGFVGFFVRVTRKAFEKNVTLPELVNAKKLKAILARDHQLHINTKKSELKGKKIPIECSD